MSRRLPSIALVVAVIVAGVGARGCKPHVECDRMDAPASCRVVQP